MAEPIYPPTYPGEVLTLAVDVEDTSIYWPLNLQSAVLASAGPAVVDDSPAALIARLTSGDAGGEWGHQRVDFYVARCQVTGRRYEVVSAATESDQLEVTRITAPTYAEARRKVGEYLAAGS